MLQWFCWWRCNTRRNTRRNTYTSIILTARAKRHCSELDLCKAVEVWELLLKKKQKLFFGTFWKPDFIFNQPSLFVIKSDLFPTTWANSQNRLCWISCTNHLWYFYFFNLYYYFSISNNWSKTHQIQCCLPEVDYFPEAALSEVFYSSYFHSPFHL